MFNKWKSPFWPPWADQSSAVGSQEWNPRMGPGVWQPSAPYPLSTTLTIAPLVSVPAEFKTLVLQPRKEDLHILNSLC